MLDKKDLPWQTCSPQMTFPLSPCGAEIEVKCPRLEPRNNSSTLHSTLQSRASRHCLSHSPCTRRQSASGTHANHFQIQGDKARITQSRSPTCPARRRSKFEGENNRRRASRSRTYPPPAQPVVRRVLMRYVEGVVEDLLLHLRLRLRPILRGVRRADLRRRRPPQRHPAR